MTQKGTYSPLDSYLAKNGISYTEFARRCGVTPQAMQKYARGERNPRRNIIVRIVNETGGELTADILLNIPLPIHRRICGKNTTEQQVKGL